MPQVKGNSPISHMPNPPSPQATTINVPVVANSGQRTIAAVTSGTRSLTIATATVKIDPTSHTPANIVDIINGANIPGVKASLDRYGILLIDGVAVVGGDASLLLHLGLA